MTTYYLDFESGMDGFPLTDSSSSPKSMVGGASFTNDTGTKKFGSSSGKFPGNATTTSDNGITIPANTAFTMGTGDFTIEFFINPINFTNPYCSVVGSNATSWGAGACAVMQFNAGTPASPSTGSRINKIGLTNNNGVSGADYISTSTLTIGTWTHVAFSKVSGTIYVFINGTLENSYSDSRSWDFSNNGATNIGFDGWDGSNSRLAAYVDELRITKGVGRYTSSFTAPSAPYDNTDTYYSNVSLLSHFDDTISGGLGQSFANRFKTLTKASSYLAAGDTLRIKASADSTLVGNATWTNNSFTVTLASAVNTLIDNADTAWTAATNVNTVADGWRMVGNNACRIDETSSFTTGKMAYKTLPSTLDLSSYQQVCLWMKTNSYASPAGVWQVVLCSDTTGDVPVNTLTVGEPLGDNWTPVVLDNGAALGSAIKSVAIYSTVAYGASKYLYLNHINACKASSSADALTIKDMIAPASGGPFYPVLSISGTTVTLGCGPSTSFASASLKYYGSGGSLSTYRRTPAQSQSGGTLQGSGTLASPITYSGGWDRTAMTSQTGDTWFRGLSPNVHSVDTNSKSDIYIDKLNIMGGNNAILLNGTRLRLGTCAFSASVNGVSGSGSIVTMDNVQYVLGGNTGVNVAFGATSWSGVIGKLHSNVTGISCTNTSAGFQFSVGEIKGCTTGLSASAGQRMSIRDTVFGNNTTDFSVDNGVTVNFTNCTFSTWSGFTSWYGTTVYSHKHNQTANNHMIVTDGGTIVSATDQRHTASGISWKFRPTSTNRSSAYPLSLSVAKVVCTASVASTVSIWVRRDNTNINGTLRVPGGQIAGVSTDVTTACAPTINTWTQYSVTFTPTESGVVEVKFEAYDGVGTTNNLWVDDLTVS